MVLIYLNSLKLFFDIYQIYLKSLAYELTTMMMMIMNDHFGKCEIS